jgi:PQQ-dependent catabolism-associated CXXCW motif protein
MVRPAAALLVAALLLAGPPTGWSTGWNTSWAAEYRAPAYRMSDYRAPTPDTVPGALTLKTAEVEELARSGGAVLIDVYPAPPRPAGLAPGAVWIPKARQTIPGAVWLPNVGYGALPDRIEAYFRDNLERLTEGRRDRPLVFFCEPDCWMSWNAALRAVEYGYSAVRYYPEGAAGWAAAGLALAPLQPVPVSVPDSLSSEAPASGPP